jgi:DNA polymerase-3 subunit beta
MKVTCERDKLLAAFQIAASVAPALEAGKDGTVLTATDLEVGVRVQAAGVTIEVEGTCLLNVARFGSILRESGDPVLKIETDGRSTIVRGERSEFRLLAENPEEYPTVAQFTDTGYWELPARLLKELVRRTIFAGATRRQDHGGRHRRSASGRHARPLPGGRRLQGFG